MRADKALEIAETIWEDTVQPESLFDNMINLGPSLDSLRKQGKIRELNSKVNGIKGEIIARWANLIKEVANRDNV